MFDVLYQNNHTLVIQTHAGRFDKWGDDVYGQFNMGLHVLDNAPHVLDNRATLLRELHQLTGGKIHQIHWLNQIHGNDVTTAKAQITPANADALISDECGVGLSIMTADCVPIALFNDCDGGQIACIHAGWQGLTKGIIANTVKQFFDKNIKAVIGACISQASYEIDKTLANNIINSVIDKQLVDLTFDELYQTIIEDKISNQNDTQKCLIDIVKLTRLQLAHLNITVMNDNVPCSYDKPNLYSYRQQTHAKKHATGRMAMVVVKY
ncbi:polyphenol oxidase family protein [Moraxella oblonga]|uniref:polyphenol oxidase family protein n=1 Tax=Moraxella oblonga TaxID=200413 RepID=UPI00082F3041|nr:polyphenol oxidase family protein [Moraxella oblonga]